MDREDCDKCVGVQVLDCPNCGGIETVCEYCYYCDRCDQYQD